MSKVMLYTGYLNYESFAEPGDNPVAESKVFDVSTPEKLKRAKVYALLDQRYGDYIECLEEPMEPKFSLTEMKDTKKVECATKKYEREMARFEETKALFDLSEKFFDSDDSVEQLANDFPDDFVDTLFNQMQNQENDNGAVPQAYIFDIEDAT